MRTVTRLQTFNVVGVSIIAHLLLLTVLRTYQPHLSQRLSAKAEELQVIPVVILRERDIPPPPPPPEAPKQAELILPPPTAVRVTPTLVPQELISIAPLVAPLELPPLILPDPEPEPPPPPSEVVLRPYGDSVGEDPAIAGVRNALRGSLIGCANASILGLSREERERCQDQFAGGAKDAALSGLGLDAALSAEFDAALAKKDANIRYRDGSITAGPAGGSSGELNEPLSH